MQELWGPPLRQGPAEFGLGGVPQALGCVTGSGARPLGWPAGCWAAEKTCPAAMVGTAPFAHSFRSNALL